MAGAVRQLIDIPKLEKYISPAVPEIQLPIDVKQFGFGQSNPTYQLTAKNGQKYVMRKKPPGKLVSKTAHKVEREYRIIHALERTDVSVPKTYCLCNDDSVVGTSFYIMEFLDGRIIEDPSIPGVTPEERTEMSLIHELPKWDSADCCRWHDAIRTLAKLHRIVPRDVGLEDFGKPTEFYNRQIATFQTISSAQSNVVDIETNIPVGQIPHFDEMVEFFKDQKIQPKDQGNIIHGDYKIDNLIFHKTKPRIIGIIDWEMATIGHPLSDLVNITMPWLTATSGLDPTAAKTFLSGATPGLPTREQVVEWYKEVAGWDPNPDLNWGAAFGIFRASVVLQGIAARYAMKQASSAQAKPYTEMFQPFGRHAYEMVKIRMDAVGWKQKMNL